MAQSDVQICNMALGHLGVGQTITTLTERSAEAAACNQFYTEARDAVLRDFPWPFTKKTAALALVTSDEDDTHPTDEWSYSYRYPSDCERFLRIESGTRNDTRQSRVPMQIYHDDAGKLIYTDKVDAVAQYAALVTAPERFDADFTLALSFRLAAYIAPRVTKGDPFKRQEACLLLYRLELEKAWANAVNEEQDEEEPESQFTRERNT